MARIIYTDEVDLSDLDEEQQDWLYNAKDCCITYEVDQALEPKLNPSQQRIYRFERAQQAVALDMMRRGLRVNLGARDAILHELISQRVRIDGFINRLAQAMWGRGLNPKSPPQMQEFFYDFLKLSPVYRKDKGQKVRTTNIEALEQFRTHYYIRPIVNAILASGDLHGQIKVLASGVDPDGRFRSSFNVGGTETGRWSSSKNPNGRGTNLQNITPRMRKVFVADEGEIFVAPDLEQAESRAVAYLSGDEAFIRACESFDLHTSVAVMIWRDVEWKPGDNARNLAIAKQENFYRHFSRRDLAKRGGHLLNYKGTPFKLTFALHLDKLTAERFHADYFSAFPGIARWHDFIASTLQETARLTTPFGRERTFFSRLHDERTVKEAIASIPQSTIGDLLNLGLLKVWFHLQLKERLIHCLLQLHDGFMAGVPEDKLDVIIPRMQELMTIPLVINGRTMIVPVAFKVGYNWKDMEPYGSEAAAKLKRDSLDYDPTKWIAA